MGAAKKPERIENNPYLGDMEQFVTENAGLVYSIAAKFKNIQGHDYEDIVSEGMMGLLHAYSRFDPTKTAAKRFSTYAVTCIRGYILRYIDTKYRMIRIPVHLSRQIEPPRVLSLDKSMGSEDTEHQSASYKDVLLDEDDHSRLFVNEFIDGLTDRQKDIVKYLIAGHTVADIARGFGVKRQGVWTSLQVIKERYEQVGQL
ncbi:sigma-70 family RNA polymerase sigma factor [Paenibacillus lentus]|uniref:sigma-70 family RNA polymerase sigma factor n=1 Tax=Paenibacillus lentus TaxID=1338368 RepID=UPI00365FDEA9